MKAIIENSRGRKTAFDIVAALAAHAKNRKELETLAMAVFPNGCIYAGGTHTRIMTTQDSGGESVYVDLTQ